MGTIELQVTLQRVKSRQVGGSGIDLTASADDHSGRLTLAVVENLLWFSVGTKELNSVLDL